MTTKELETVVFNWAAKPNNNGFIIQDCGELPPKYDIDPAKESHITCYTGATEMLRVAQDGFYVRGQKVPVDDKEAETVYNAFKQWLVWSELNRR